jgi:hypothetical protein
MSTRGSSEIFSPPNSMGKRRAIQRFGSGGAIPQVASPLGMLNGAWPRAVKTARKLTPLGS